MRQYRAKNGLARNRKSEKIRRVALAELRDAHREEYDKLVARIESEWPEADDLALSDEADDS